MPRTRSSEESPAESALATSAQTPVRSPSEGTTTTTGCAIESASASLVKTATTRSGTRSPGRRLTEGIPRSRSTAASSPYRTGSRVAKATCRRLNGPEDGHIAHILYRRVSACPRCGTVAEAGQLFCRRCGATVPQAMVDPRSVPIAPVSLPPPPPPPVIAPLPPIGWPPVPPLPPATAAPPPAPDWIPPGLVGRAVHCPRCNTLISPVAVVCPVCLSVQGPRAEGAGDAAPAR